MTTIRNAVLATASFTAALALSACGSGPAAAPDPAPATASAPAAAHASADIAFARGMIPHHEQAVQMSTLARDRAGERVRALAARVEQAQGPEIAQMRGLLTTWGAGEAGGMSGMDGMLSSEQLQQLARTSGAEFDRLFLQAMTAHHEGAVRMARTELASGTDPQARALAQRIVDAQESEIAEMRGLLG